MTRFIVPLDTRTGADNPRLCFMPGNYVSYGLRLPGRVCKNNEGRAHISKRLVIYACEPPNSIIHRRAGKIVPAVGSIVTRRDDGDVRERAKGVPMNNNATR